MLRLRHEVYLRTIFLLMAVVLAGCGERELLPLSTAPLREDVRDVPPNGLIPVEPHDTIYTIANRYQVIPKRIIFGNNLVPPDYDLSGLSVLNLPKPRLHIVVAGDTLDKIAQRYAVSREDIYQLNNFSPGVRLRPHMAIAIPRRVDYSNLDGVDEIASVKTAPPQSTPQTPGNTPQNTPQKAIGVAYSATAPAFSWPVDGQIIEHFGVSGRGVQNDGVNIAARLGADVRAAQDGEVAFVGRNLKGFGNLVLLKHRQGWITAYAHLDRISVQEGDRLERGQALGTVGTSGRINSPQVHFEIRKAQVPVNPQDYAS